MNVFTWNGAIDTIMSPWDSIRYHKAFLRSAFMSMDVHSGAVKAYVGGIDYPRFQYDMVNGGRRQVGSTIKPFLYSLAVIEGASPCEQILHVPQHLKDELGRPYTPVNAFPRRVGEMVTIEWGLQQSSNWVTAALMSRLSPYSLVRMLHSYGLRNYIDPVVSLALGTPEASVSEMVTGYSVFTNNGIRVSPLYVTHIEDSYGNTIATFSSAMNEVLTEDAACTMLRMLKGVADHGTAIRIRNRYHIRAEMGSKTGTTQNHSDGWFMALTPHLVSGCWVGGEDRSIHFDGISLGQGASMALPIYALYIQKIYADTTLNYTEADVFDLPEKYLTPCTDSPAIDPDDGSLDPLFD
jgi:penicillin-binding protein 1A